LFQREAFIRVPLRLGEDVFTRGVISRERTEQLVKALTGFRHLVDAYGAENYMACATAAMREARNGNEIVESLQALTGVNVRVVNGTREAEMICANHAETLLKKERSFLYVDVGGGSTDVTFLSKSRPPSAKSFPIGTIRVLERVVRKSDWDNLKSWLHGTARNERGAAAIGSGGNINKIFKLARHKEGKPLSYKRLKRVHEFLRKHTLEERIRDLNLRPDRADVIVPAARIYLAVMKWAGIRRIYVPQIGLPDGMIHVLYEEMRARKSVISVRHSERPSL
jgi:exopolyphosphatase/guanosine-5'-triphosphate,3'-diphosphate pyrophosphatase